MRERPLGSTRRTGEMIGPVVGRSDALLPRCRIRTVTISTPRRWSTNLGSSILAGNTTGPKRTSSVSLLYFRTMALPTHTRALQHVTNSLSRNITGPCRRSRSYDLQHIVIPITTILRHTIFRHLAISDPRRITLLYQAAQSIISLTTLKCS
jgi:hypothetical protein